MSRESNLRNIPAVDKLLNNNIIKLLLNDYGDELVKYCIRNVLDELRSEVVMGRKSRKGKQEKGKRNSVSFENLPELNLIIGKIEKYVKDIGKPSLKHVINATGVILHTNLGRAPLGEYVLNEIAPVVRGYSNLEFDLKTGKRGHRKDHITGLIKFLTRAEDAIVVNNNAAAVLLVLKAFAYRKEVIISRGELIEIGGSFRIPEIMKASGAKMVEVGTTNRTRISDYKKAITDKSAIIFKAHKSNYYIGGFTEEVELSELSALAKMNNLLMVYDIGSGLLRKPKGLPLKEEPDVRTSLKSGIDLITFSCDKLLGGPQAGIIAGKKELIARLSKAPMMRTLRVDKLIIAALSAVLRNYINDEKLLNRNPAFSMLTRPGEILLSMAEKLSAQFAAKGIKSTIIQSKAQCGGGALPHLIIDSFAVVLNSVSNKSAEQVYKKLQMLDQPVIAVLREGKLTFDVLTIFEEDIPIIAESVKRVL